MISGGSPAVRTRCNDPLQKARRATDRAGGAVDRVLDSRSGGGGRGGVTKRGWVGGDYTRGGSLKNKSKTMWRELKIVVYLWKFISLAGFESFRVKFTLYPH